MSDGPPIWFVIAFAFISLAALGVIAQILSAKRSTRRQPGRRAEFPDPADLHNPASPLYMTTTGQIVADSMRSTEPSSPSHSDHHSSPSFPTDSGPSSFPSSHESGHSSGGHS